MCHGAEVIKVGDVLGLLSRGLFISNPELVSPRHSVLLQPSCPTQLDGLTEAEAQWTARRTSGKLGLALVQTPMSLSASWVFS